MKQNEQDEQTKELLDTYCHMIASHEKLKLAQKEIKQTSLTTNLLLDNQLMTSLLIMLK